jgi:hypothetical protein
LLTNCADAILAKSGKRNGAQGDEPAVRLASSCGFASSAEAFTRCIVLRVDVVGARRRVLGALERSLTLTGDSLEKDRADLAWLAEEQAALRRVATLVARGSPADELFAAVTQEVGLLLPVDFRAHGPLRRRRHGHLPRRVEQDGRSLPR